MLKHLSKFANKYFIDALLHSFHDYTDTLHASRKSSLQNPLNNFIKFCTLNDINHLTEHSDSISKTLYFWINHFHHNNTIKTRTSNDYARTFFKFISHLIHKGLLPSIELPTSNSSNPPKNKVATLLKNNNTDNPIKFNEFKFKAHIKNNQTKFGPPVDLTLLKDIKNGSAIAKSFRQYLNKFATDSHNRPIRAFKKFISFIANNFEASKINLKSKDFMLECTNAYKIYVLTNNGNVRLLTIHNEWQSLYLIYNYFSQLKYFAKISLPILVPKKNIRVLQDLQTETSILSMSIQNLIRHDANGAIVINALELSSSLDNQFLDALERDETYVFNLIRECAIKEVRKSIKTYKKGMSLVKKCNIEYLRRVYAHSGALLDPNILGRSSQPISFFSADHPNGLINLLGWIWHEHNGLAMDGSFPGIKQYENHGGISKIKNYLGLNKNNATAFFTVILGETGINVSSLERAEISDQYGNDTILIPTDDAQISKFIVEKPRARKMISKSLIKPSSSLLTNYNEDLDICAHTCLEYIISSTSRYRKANNTKQLWIIPSSTKTPYAPTRISETGFKKNHKYFLNRHEILKDFNHKYLTRKIIRISGGIIKWLRTGGDAFAAAKYYGNQAQTAINTYLPKQIQEIFFRRDIKKFQSLLIIATTKNNSATQRLALPEISEQDIQSTIHQIRTNKEMISGDIFRYITETSDQDEETTNNNKVTFILSPENIAFLKLTYLAIEEAMLIEPGKFNPKELFAGQPLSYWSELWVLTSKSLKNSPNRTHKTLFNCGLHLYETHTRKLTLNFRGEV